MRNLVVFLVAAVSVGLAGLAYAGGAGGCGCPIAKGTGDVVKVAALSGAVAVDAGAQAAPVNAGNKICPVMGSPVAVEGGVKVEYKGKAYNLCCPMCKAAFLKDPEKYLKKVEAELAPALKS